MMQRMEQIWFKKMDVHVCVNSRLADMKDQRFNPTRKEGPRREEGLSVLFTGIQIVNPKVFLKIPELSFSLNLVLMKLLNKRLFGIVHDGEWLMWGHLKVLRR